MQSPPTPEQIKQARKDAGLTQAQAAELIYKSLRCWQQWEAKEGTKDHRKMDAAFWELFCLKLKKYDQLQPPLQPTYNLEQLN